MNWRWFFPILLIALAFYGISKENATRPNQEIVVQFDANTVNTDDARQAVSEITNRLKQIGVADIHVSELRNGKLKVTYFSTVDVALVKNLISNPNSIPLNDSFPSRSDDAPKTPQGENSGTYKLVVIEIQKDYKPGLGFHGVPVELKTVKDQYFTQLFPLTDCQFNFNLKRTDESVAYKNYRGISFLIDSSFRKIPEVRAGPLC